MARREVTDCDRCKAKEIQAGTVHIPVGYNHCPAGGRGSDDVERIDLCVNCLVAMVNWLQKKFDLSYEVGRELVAWTKQGSALREGGK